MKKNKGLKSQLPNIIFGLIFIVGVAIFLYPSISNYINTKHQSRVVASYDEALANLTTEDYSSYWKAAKEFNERLAKAQSSSFLTLDGELKAKYYDTLDPTGTGVIGTIEIENIGVRLPIYHGTEETVLQMGIGHLEGSSFPTGTTSTHCILSGHRGLPSAKLFTDLDQMIVGDTFLLHILDQTFAYQVDNISIVLPEDTGGLGIVDGEEYVTLVTCTPYGVNTHRLLVRAKRVDYNEETKLIVPADATRYGTLMIAPFIGAPMLLIAFIVFMVMTRKPKAKKVAKN
ncbi:sortase A [Butyrivibrio sp. Su6]|uniref:class C sortase n=1 Tax=Butyrivibrio sp. Su6 TaxID=1520810 RepID=UPI00089EA478|nr:class C sortase [Butyrivibrio sp. Su6]SEF73899.1 sortase A [Butyrivibrio sp. Su6]